MHKAYSFCKCQQYVVVTLPDATACLQIIAFMPGTMCASPLNSTYIEQTPQ